MIKTEPAVNALSNYVHLKDDGHSELLAVSETFWQQLAQGAFPHLQQGRLLTVFSFTAAWDVWECHPAGEEVVMLLAGTAELVLDENGISRQIELRQPGDIVLVPAGVWHTATTAAKATLLFITAGAGTCHKPVS